MSLLETITGPEMLRSLTEEQEKQLCQEIRSFLIEHIPQTGGHLASNLGVVELTLAIHKVFDTTQDKLIFDVGHQCYVHKLLTGRQEGFSHLRAYGGMSGFPKPYESKHDAFIAGHASNAVSVALGFARARTRCGAHYSVVALLGDGALTGGLAYEGLNDAGQSGEPLIVILNDNGMSIAKNVGGISEHLAYLRLRPRYFRIKLAYRKFTQTVPGGRKLYRITHAIKQRMKRFLLGSTMFEEMGFVYLGPVDGHDLQKLTYLLQVAREMRCPVLIHAITKKGRGSPEAEAHPDRYHGLSVPEDVCCSRSFSQEFGEALSELAQKDSRICAITAAMPSGTGLSEFAKSFPDRMFDVGIAEGHAVSMASGLAAGGMLPVVAIYSTFLQRSFDMLLHDAALMQNHVVFAVDRAGLVGEDGETHHGVFDVAYLRQVPGMTIYCPATTDELRQMLHAALYDCKGPAAIRYPRGGSEACQVSERYCEKPDVTIVCYGTMVFPVLQAAALLSQKGVEADVIRLQTIKPLRLEELLPSVRASGRMVVVEEVVSEGCVGTALSAQLQELGCRPQLLLRNLGDRFLPHGARQTLLSEAGLDAEGLCRAVMEGFHFE